MMARWLAIACAVWSTASAVAGTVTGSVVDSTGAIISRATVYLRSEQPAGFRERTTTDENGSFHFTLAAAGSYRIDVHSPGFFPEMIAGVPVAEGAAVALPPMKLQVAILGCGETDRVVPGDVRLLHDPNERGIVRGAVANERGVALAGVIVTPNCGPNSKCLPVRTDVNGRFQFSAPNRQKVSVTVSHPGYFLSVQKEFTTFDGTEFLYDPIRLARCNTPGCHKRTKPPAPPFTGVCL
ncbi:MAG: carboxypeptidase-like regulatory domain-containing protein [Acidobacteriota bacterium]